MQWTNLSLNINRNSCIQPRAVLWHTKFSYKYICINMGSALEWYLGTWLISTYHSGVELLDGKFVTVGDVTFIQPRDVIICVTVAFPFRIYARAITSACAATVVLVVTVIEVVLTSVSIGVKLTLLLKHWDWHKMASISQTIFLKAISWMKTSEFQIIFHWKMFLGVQLTI